MRYTHTVLRNALAQAVRWRLCTTNPADVVDLPRKQKREMRAMSLEEANRFLVAAREDDLYTFFSLLLTTGLRPSEAIALKWSDVDLTRGGLSVNRTVTRRKGGWYFGAPKTLKSRRHMKIPASVARLLVEHRKTVYPGEHDLVFPNANGDPLCAHNAARRNYKRALARAGLSMDFRLYDLRHTCATLMLVAGVHPKVVSERLGHASVKITLDTYSHVLPTMQREATEKLGNLLYEGDKTERLYN